MAKKKSMGRPLSEGAPLDVRICGYFSEVERTRLSDVASQLTAAEGERVTVAEVIRRAVRIYLKKTGARK